MKLKDLYFVYQLNMQSLCQIILITTVSLQLKRTKQLPINCFRKPNFSCNTFIKVFQNIFPIHTFRRSGQSKKKQNQNKACKLLFVAHREEILEQSIDTFRGVLKDANFGELFVGNHRPDNIDNCDMSKVYNFALLLSENFSAFNA